MTRTSKAAIKVVVRRRDVSSFKRDGAWTVLSTYTGCGLAGTFDSIPERGRVKPVGVG